LRDDAASHLVYVPDRKAPGKVAPPAERRPSEPDAASAELS